MKKKPPQASHQVDDNSEKEFQISLDNTSEKQENAQQLLSLLDSPWQLVKNGGKYGVSSVKRFFIVLFLFGVCNTLLFFYAVVRLFSSGFTFGKLLFVFLVLIIGIAVTVWASYRTYQYIVVDTIRVIYENLSSLFKKLTDLLVDKAEGVFDGNVNLSNQEFSKVIDVKETVYQTYDILPGFLKKGVVLILTKIPIVELLTELKGDITSGNKTTASSKLYNKLDGFITESIFGNNNIQWLWWLLPLNIIGVIAVVKFQIG